MGLYTVGYTDAGDLCSPSTHTSMAKNELFGYGHHLIIKQVLPYFLSYHNWKHIVGQKWQNSSLEN